MSAVATLDGVAALGPEWDGVFAGGPGIQSRRDWFAATEDAALPHGARPLYLAWTRGEARALLAMQTGAGHGARSLTSPYSVLFQPLLTAGADAEAAGLGLGGLLRAWSTATLEALDPDWPGLDPFLRGARRAGLLALRFDHFGNWHEAIAGRDWPAYLSDRPGALRETIRRKGRLAARDASVRFETVRDADRLDAALEAYEAVYARSWKVPEPFPRFNAALLRRLAARGAMRMGLMWQGGVPIAAQYWTIEDGVATVLKLAHDDTAKALSPGTLLTAHVVQALLAEGGLRALDFGRGDDPYKQQWAGVRRQRIGVVLVNPLRPQGLATLLRHGAGLAVRRLRALRE